MPLSRIPLAQVDQARLQNLLDDAVSEGRRIEYKSSIGRRDEDRREFLADISSFANAAGGDLLVGISETNGTPNGISGIPVGELDAETLRLENMIRDGIEPRISGVAVHPVAIADRSTAVLIIRIPRSWSGPHMVTFRGHSRFYSRNSAGKYPLDVSEIRAAFVGSATAQSQLSAFRLERLGRLLANDGPIRLRDDPKTVLHVVPLSAVDSSVRYDVAEILASYDNPNFRPLTGMAWNHRINFDGALTYAPGDDRGAQSYTQVFRTGAIEGVEAFMLRREYNGREHLIPSTDFETSLIDALGRYLALLSDIEASPPYLIGLSLLGVRGLRMAVSQRYFSGDVEPIDRDDLIIPEEVLETVAAPPHTLMRPLLDAVWNAVGWKCSPNYDNETGEWRVLR